MKYFKKFENIFFINGYNRGMIIDPQRGNYEFVPNELINFVNNFDNSILTKECKIEYKEYIDYLKLNEYCYLSKTKEKYFPKIEIIYKSPSFFENAIIEINNKIEIKKYFSTLEKINNIGCSNFLIYSKEIIDYNLIVKTLDFFSNKYIDTLILYLNYIDIDFIEKLKLLFEKYNFIKQIIIFNSLFDQLININNGYDILVTTRKKLDFYDWNKDVNIMNYSFLHFLEAKNYNTYFNKKISIDYNGIIKNSPNSEVTYGNISNLSEYDLKKLADSNDYNKIWFISKDYINVCKDCEFRFSCTDSRIPININNEWFYESECNYNPYISKWSNEIGYRSLSDIGKFNDFIFYPDKNVITKINKELWEKA